MRSRNRNPKPPLPRRLKRELAEPIHMAGVTYQQRYVWCGKMTCERWHGPYWYAFFKTRGRNTTRAKYLGRMLPPSVVEAFMADAGSEEHLAREARRELVKRKRSKR